MSYREENDNIVSRLKKLEESPSNTNKEILEKINNNILKLIELQKDILTNLKNKRFNNEYNYSEDSLINMTNNKEDIEFMPSIDDSMEVKKRSKRTIQKQEIPNEDVPGFMKQEDK